MTRRSAFLLIVFAILASGTVRAAEVTRVVSASQGRRALPDLSLSVAWLRDSKTATIKREFQGPSTGGTTTLAKDLVYSQTRNLLRLRADVGLFRDLSLFVTAPIVLSDDRSLSFDRGDSSCDTLAPTAFSPSCVNDTSSSILRDGILDRSAATGEYGWDATHDRRFQSPDSMVFRGPTRSGLEYLGIGLGWAVLNQAKDDTKPTWMVRLESRFAVGPDMRFDAAKPGDNTGVGTGYHQFIFSTMFSRRFDRFDPYLGGWYMLPSERADSIYKDIALGSGAYAHPQHRAGTEFGVELKIWDKPRDQQRVTLEVRGRMELRFFGLAQAELWEPLSGKSRCALDALACRPGLDLDPSDKMTANNGVTRSPSYGALGGDAGLNVAMGKSMHFRSLFGLTWEQDHFLTDGRSGNRVYDLPGRRFKVEDARVWHLLVDGRVAF